MKGFLKFIGGFLSVILSICFFAFILAWSISNIASSTLSSKGIKNYVSDLNIMDLPISLVDENSSNENETVADTMRDYLTESGLSKTEADKILNNDNIKKEMNSFLGSVIAYSLYQDDKPNLDSSNIIKGLSESGIKLNATDEKSLKNAIKEINDEIVMEIPDSKENEEESMKYLEMINSMPLTLYLLIGIIGFFVLIALFRWNLYAPFIWLGIPTLISGVILGIIFLVKSIIFNLLPENITEYTDLLNSVTKPLFNKIGLQAIILIISGILGIVLYSIIKKKIKNKDFNKPLSLETEVKA